MTIDDLGAHTNTWEQPISVDYRGLRVWECPPNGQGLIALLALNLLEGFDLAALPPLSAERQSPAPRVAGAHARIRAVAPRLEEDRTLHRDIEAVGALLDAGVFDG